MTFLKEQSQESFLDEEFESFLNAQRDMQAYQAAKSPYSPYSPFPEEYQRAQPTRDDQIDMLYPQPEREEHEGELEF